MRRHRPAIFIGGFFIVLAALGALVLAIAIDTAEDPSPVAAPTTTEATTTTTSTTTTTTTTTTVPTRQPMPEAFVAGLVVSMGEPTAEAVARYADWNANAIALWEPEEAEHWSDYPAYVWVTHDGQQINEPADKEDPTTWQPLELPPNVFAVQAGDEPIPAEAVDNYPLHRPMPGRLTLPDGVTQFTNWSFWTPMVIDAVGMEPTLDIMFEDYVGDVVTVGEYQMGEGRYTILNYFRQKALDRGQPYWQYLNAYAGAETDYEAKHSPSDLAWQAFSGAAMGYTGHVWFTYALGADHGEFNGNNRGSIIHAPRDTFTETDYWQVTAEINAPLLALTRQVAGHTSTGVCWDDCAPVESTEPVLVGTFEDDAGTESWVVMNSNHTAAGSDEPAEVTVPFDGTITFPEHRAVTAGDTVTIEAGHAIRVTE